VAQKREASSGGGLARGRLPGSWLRPTVARLVPALVLAGVVVGAIATGARVGPVIGPVESLSSSSTTALGRLVSAAPLGYAFGAGVVAAFNPCGFALLPSYLGLYLGTADMPTSRPGMGLRLLNALRVGGTVSLGFVLLFGLAGIVLSLVAATIVRWLPWLALAVGVVLVFIAGRLLAGAPVYTRFGEELAARLGERTRVVGLRGFFAYGVAYGLASLSCTLPIFLAVVGSALARSGFLSAFSQLVLYALGMGVVMCALTIGVALFTQGAVRWAGRVLPVVQPVSALLLLAAGAYIVYYWLTIGGLFRTFSGA